MWSAATCPRFLFHFARNSDETEAFLVWLGSLEKESDDESSHSKRRFFLGLEQF
jgi:hypothetical protein